MIRFHGKGSVNKIKRYYAFATSQTLEIQRRKVSLSEGRSLKPHVRSVAFQEQPTCAPVVIILRQFVQIKVFRCSTMGLFFLLVFGTCGVAAEGAEL